MTKLSKIEVPLVQDDLKHNETIIQIANTLDILDQSIRNVFDHVNKSIGRTRQTLRSIEARNSVVCNKIEQLKAVQKSVTILSKNKYPYSIPDGGNYRIDFDVAPKLVLPTLTSKPDSPAGVMSPTGSGDIESKLKFYHVKTEDMLRKNVELVCEETLGKVPGYIDSITSCMLFNTSDNVYEKYVIVDPLSSGQVVKPSRPDSIPQLKMEDAPKSLHNEDDLLIRRQTYGYSPSVEAVPVIELPTDLPDLIGFADDFRYMGENLEAVTKPASGVVARQPSIPSEPDYSPLSSTTPITPQPTYQKSEHITPSTINTEQTAAATIPISSPPAAPPPPPLPPPSPPSTAAIPEPASSSLHANLMAAIRSAGGSGKAKLRSVDETVSSAGSASVSATKNSQASSGGDLMSDLAAKLSLRRKGISGTQASAGKEGGSLLDKLMLSIPPPPVKEAESSGSENRSDTEAEWDD